MCNGMIFCIKILGFQMGVDRLNYLHDLLKLLKFCIHKQLLTKFLSLLPKKYPSIHKKSLIYTKSDYIGLIDTTVYGIILTGKSAFS